MTSQLGLVCARKVTAVYVVTSARRDFTATRNAAFANVMMLDQQVMFATRPDNVGVRSTSRGKIAINVPRDITDILNVYLAIAIRPVRSDSLAMMMEGANADLILMVSTVKYASKATTITLRVKNVIAILLELCPHSLDATANHLATSVSARKG